MRQYADKKKEFASMNKERKNILSTDEMNKNFFDKYFLVVDFRDKLSLSTVFDLHLYEF